MYACPFCGVDAEYVQGNNTTWSLGRNRDNSPLYKVHEQCVLTVIRMLSSKIVIPYGGDVRM